MRRSCHLLSILLLLLSCSKDRPYDNPVDPGSRAYTGTPSVDADGDGVGSYKDANEVSNRPRATAGPDTAIVPVGVAVRFEGSAIDPGNTQPPGSPGRIVRYSWDFGDGTVWASTTTGETTHTYRTAGTYRAVFTTYDSEGNNAIDAIQVTVNPPPNKTPVANAGPDQSVVGGANAQLDGSGSSDPDGDALTYRWTAPGGVTLSSATVARPVLTARAGGVYRLTLVVSDGKTTSATDEVVVTVANRAPTASAGQDQTVEVGATVTLDGRSSRDADGDALTYAWTAPAGVKLNSTTVSRPLFVAQTSGAYRFTLVVSDGHSDSSPDWVVVTVQAVGGKILTVPPGGSIAAAMAQAVAGDVVLLGRGTHSEGVVLKSGVVVRGEDRTGTILRSSSEDAITASDVDAATVANLTVAGPGVVVFLFDSQVTLSDCDIRDQGVFAAGSKADVAITDCQLSGNVPAVLYLMGARGDFAGNTIEVNGTSVPGQTAAMVVSGTGTAPDIHDNVFRRNARWALWVADGATPRIAANTVSGNSPDSAYASLGVAGSGTNPTVDGNTFTGNGFGIAVSDGAGGAFMRNSVANSTYTGFWVSGVGTEPTVNDNTFTGNSIGIGIGAGATGTYSRNTVSGSTLSGIIVDGGGTNPNLTRNTVADNGEDGIYVYDGAGGTITGNVLRTNGFYGIEVRGLGSAPTIDRNELSGNARGGILVTDGASPVIGTNTGQGVVRAKVVALPAGTAPGGQDEASKPALPQRPRPALPQGPAPPPRAR